MVVYNSVLPQDPFDGLGLKLPFWFIGQYLDQLSNLPVSDPFCVAYEA